MASMDIWDECLRRVEQTQQRYYRLMLTSSAMDRTFTQNSQIVSPGIFIQLELHLIYQMEFLTTKFNLCFQKKGPTQEHLNHTLILQGTFITTFEKIIYFATFSFSYLLTLEELAFEMYFRRDMKEIVIDGIGYSYIYLITSGQWM